MHVTTENTRPPVMGVIDTLSAGYNLVGRHPWLIAVPIVLDLLLWAGPRLGIAPLVADFLRVTATPAELGPEYAETIQVARESLTAMAARASTCWACWRPGSWACPPSSAPAPWAASCCPPRRLAFELTSWLALLAVVLLLMLASVWIAAVYLAPLAQTVREGAVTPATAAAADLEAGWRLTMWLGVILGAAVASALPMTLLAGLLMVLQRQPGLVLHRPGLDLADVGGRLHVLRGRSPSRVGQAGVFRSIWNSLNVVRWNLSPALGLVIVVNVIQRGLPMVWETFATEAWGAAA